MDICLNASIRSNLEGFNHLTELYHKAKASKDKKINFNFLNTSWFEANLSAVLGAIIELLSYDGKNILISNIKPRVQDILIRNYFLEDFGFSAPTSISNTIARYKKFNLDSDDEFMDYIKKELLSKPDFPTHSKRLGKKINESIFELYENARTHGHCRQIHACGQYFPNKYPKRLDITIVDMGITIKKNVNDFLKQELSGYETINWALQYGTTTKTGNISGGLGLDIIFKFIKLNNGKIQIISSDGYWEYKKGSIKTYSFELSFPGTIANIEFNLDDSNTYHLKEEISLDDIF